MVGGDGGRGLHSAWYIGSKSPVFEWTWGGGVIGSSVGRHIIVHLNAHRGGSSSPGSFYVRVCRPRPFRSFFALGQSRLVLYLCAKYLISGTFLDRLLEQ